MCCVYLFVCLPVSLLCCFCASHWKLCLFQTVAAFGCRVGLGICYDIRFAEMAQIYRHRGNCPTPLVHLSNCKVCCDLKDTSQLGLSFDVTVFLTRHVTDVLGSGIFFRWHVLRKSFCLQYLLSDKRDSVVIDRLCHSKTFKLLMIRTEKFCNSLIPYCLNHYD